jgi:hypothetical protein
MGGLLNEGEETPPTPMKKPRRAGQLSQKRGEAETVVSADLGLVIRGDVHGRDYFQAEYPFWAVAQVLKMGFIMCFTTMLNAIFAYPDLSNPAWLYGPRSPKLAAVAAQSR